jgi:hypothetical protein
MASLRVVIAGDCLQVSEMERKNLKRFGDSIPRSAIAFIDPETGLVYLEEDSWQDFRGIALYPGELEEICKWNKRIVEKAFIKKGLL